MPLSKKIAINQGGIHGNCWFAGEDIQAGEALWWPGPLMDCDVKVKIADLLTWPEEKISDFMNMAYQVDEETMAGLNPDRSLYPSEYVAENYVNHSCDGNAWYVDGGEQLVAMRDIKKGEEITYDYALHAAHPIFKLNCRCGSSKCRGTVTGDDWRKPEIQARYGNHFLAHVYEKIQALKH